MRYESLKENFYNIPYILSGKVISLISKKVTPVTGGYAPFPEVISFYLTERCNLNCKMCFLKNINYSLDFIPLDIAKKVVKELMPVRPRYGMSGGEPLLYPDIEELISYIKTHELSLSIVTNGTKLLDFAEFIVHSGVDRIKVSIDGPPEVHDKIRGVPGTFSKLEKGIDKINKEKKKRGKRKPRLFLYSLLHSNCDVNFIVSFAEKYKFDVINFLHILYIHEEDLKSFEDIQDVEPHYWRGAVFDDTDYRINAELINKIKSIDTSLDITFTPDISLSELYLYYNKDKNYLKRFKSRCNVPWVAAFIKPPSKVEICPDAVIGDIENMRFLKVWNSSRARNLRQRIHSGNMLPVCSGCCSYYM